MDLYVLDESYTMLGMLSSPTAFSYIERVRSKSEFAVYLPMDERNAELVKEDNLILFDSKKGIAGVIAHIYKNVDDSGVTKLEVTGSLCDEYMYRRICWGIYSKSGYASDIIAGMIDSQITNPDKPERAIKDFVMRESRDIKGAEITYQSTGGNVGDNVDSICTTNGFCRRARLDYSAKKIYLELYNGVDRTVTQKTVPPCVFSQKFENILSSTYDKNLIDYKNAALAAGEGEGAARIYVEPQSQFSGKKRREVFIDARTVSSQQSDGTILSPEEYKSVLLQKANETLGGYRLVENFDCVVNTQGNIQYEKDYFLGDKVTIVDVELGIEVDAEITEVEKAWDSNGLTIFITFGFGSLTLSEKLKVKEVH